jgi:hypothetical protein
VTVSLAFCFAAQRAFMSADNSLFAAALIGRRTAVFLGVALTCFGEDFPFHLVAASWPQRCACGRLGSCGDVSRQAMSPLADVRVVVLQ